jgi:hypothetical protein
MPLAPNQSILGGDFDGDWLVYSVNSTPNSFGDWRLYAFNVQKSRLLDVARVDTTGGQPIPGPIVIPVVDHGLMAWTQSVQSGETQVHLHDLNAGTDKVLSAHHPGAPVFAWPWVVWQEPTGAPGSPEVFRLFSLDTQLPTPLPKALSSVRTVQFLAGAQGSLAWTATDQRSLWIWKTGQSEAQRVFQAPEGDYAEFITLGNELMTWNGVDSQWAADLRSLTATQIAPSSGSPKVRSGGLTFDYAVGNPKASSAAYRVFVLATAGLAPLPSCS